MKRPKDVKLEFTRQWVDKFEADFRIAEHLFKGGKEVAYGTAFHAQQAAAKISKSASRASVN